MFLTKNYILLMHEKNNFIEVCKNLNTDLKIILLKYQNNCVGILSMMSNAARSFDILAINLSVYNYFNNLTKLFLSLYLTKFLDQ